MQIQTAPYGKGTIYLVGVPIGDYNDMSIKAVKALQNSDVIFAEDTRRAGLLLSHFEIKDKKVYQHHEHNEQNSAKGVIEMAQQGQTVAYISDAGMPAIADPGFVLAKMAIEQGMQVVPVAGPNAGLLGLVASGLPTDSFTFVGFLPRGESHIIKKLEEYKNYKETLLFYESPRRILKTLQVMYKTFGNRQVCLAREITKIHEEFIRSDLTQAIAELKSRDKILGEFCIVVAGQSKSTTITDGELIEEIKKLSAENISAKQIKNDLAAKYNIKKKRVYDLYLGNQNHN